MELHSLDKRNSHSSHSVPPAVQANTEKHHLEERRGKQQQVEAWLEKFLWWDSLG